MIAGSQSGNLPSTQPFYKITGVDSAFEKVKAPENRGLPNTSE